MSIAVPTTLEERPSRAILAFRVGYALLGLNFLIPALSYIVAPAATYETLDQVNRLLGGGAYPAESGHLWHMLGTGNVMTLAFFCFLLLFDLRRFHPALPALLFLKGFSAAYALAIGLANSLPVFVAVFVLDALTTLALWQLASRAHREMTR